MVDVIVYKHEPVGRGFIHDKLLGLRPRIYHLSQQTWAGLCVLYTLALAWVYIDNINFRYFYNCPLTISGFLNQ